MRGLIFLILLLFNVNFFAQINLEKSIISNASNYIFEFDIIDHIEIIESENPKKVTVVSEASDSHASSFTLEEVNGNVYLKNFETNFPDEKENIDKMCKVQPDYTSFKIKVPKEKNILVTFVDGNFYLNQFQGNLELILNDGLVEVNKFKGSVLVKISGGKVICSGIKDARIDVETNQGSINTALAFKELQSNKNKINAIYGLPTNSLKIKGINANIYLK